MALRYLLPGQMDFMQQNGFEVVMISADGPELSDAIANENCRHIIVPMTRKITPVTDLKCLWKLIKIFRAEKPDVVHSHTPKAGLLGMLAARISGVKVRIHTVAGMPLMVEKGLKLKLLIFIEKLTYWSANQVWPNSPSLFRYITANRFTSADKLKVIAKGSTNGINLNRFNKTALKKEVIDSVKQQIGYSEGCIYLLCIARLVSDKGIVELVHVFTKLQTENSRLRLVLAGNFEQELDPLPNDILQQIKENPGIIHISWTNQVEYFMHVADYFVFPSHREGFPNVLLQAGAMELPVICSKIVGNVDIVTHNETGLVFETADETQMYRHIQFAIANPQQMKIMAGTLYKTIQEHYRRENVWKNILANYNALLNENSNAAKVS